MTTFWTFFAVVVYLALIVYLGYKGYKATRGTTDYLLAGRETHPYIMAMSYGATFISTSAIVGFGGAAGVFGMGLLWLTVLNIFFGIFIAFVCFGGRTRQLGRKLDAHTFPELLGRRYQSRFIQVAAALLIFAAMPLYASAVLIGAAKYLAQQFHLSYEVALLIFSVLVTVYVIMGGLKGVMYSDALQGTIMLFGMSILLILSYHKLGGILQAHQKLTDMAFLVPENLRQGGHRGWTTMPAFGSPIWWTLISTIVMGVGIGVLAQPQLAIRYMTVKSRRELNRAVAVGGVFILMMTGVAFVVGALTNIYFYENSGKIAIAAAGGDVEAILPMFIKGSMPGWFAVLFMLTLLSAAMSTINSQIYTMGTAAGRDFYEQTFARNKLQKAKTGLLATRIGIIAGVLISVYLGYYLEKSFGKAGVEIVARGTSIFFGLCASAFLPMYAAGLWSRSVTRAAAIAGMLSGAATCLFWMFFINETSAKALLLCNILSGRNSLAIGASGALRLGPFVWAYVDPMIIGLPIAIIVTILVSLFSKKMCAKHLKRCFEN